MPSPTYIVPAAPDLEDSRGRRADIQGLRALAVLMVMAFHANLPVPGGFVGVDVFFVISGFVITRMLSREWQESGRIRFGRFYLRRFKRLTPALALMVTVTVIVSGLLLSPLGQQQAVSWTGLGAMLLSANLVIDRTSGEYFDAPAESNPLLNTWSLSVEEQFYLVFPALLALGWYATKRGIRSAPLLIVGGVAALSVGALALGLLSPAFGSSWVFGFYSPVTRAWEFAAGALLALALAARPPAPRGPWVTWLGMLGACMLASSLWLIDGDTVFPGPWTLLPVSATLLIIIAGSLRANPVSRALSLQPMAKLGDWSYSLYLWHWPLIVFALQIWPESGIAPAVAAVLAFVPALASYAWVEQPLRSLKTPGAVRTAVLVVAVSSPPLLACASVGLSAEYYWKPRFAAGLVRPAHPGDLGQQARFDLMGQRYYPCSMRLLPDDEQEHLGLRRCLQTQPAGGADLVIMGDSHAEHLFPGLAEALPRANVMYVYLHGWPRRDTANSREAFTQVADSMTVRTVIVNSQWVGYEPTTTLEQSLKELVRAGKQVFLTDDVPRFPGMDPFRCKYRLAIATSPQCSRDAAPHASERAPAMQWLRNVASSIPGVSILATSQYFCSQDECDMTRDGRLLFEDDNHLNVDGSRYLARRMLEDNPEVVRRITAN